MDIKKDNGLHLFSHQVVSSSLQAYEMQHATLSCPSPSPSLLKLILLKKVSVQKGSIVFRPKFQNFLAVISVLHRKGNDPKNKGPVNYLIPFKTCPHHGHQSHVQFVYTKSFCAEMVNLAEKVCATQRHRFTMTSKMKTMSNKGTLAFEGKIGLSLFISLN